MMENIVRFEKKDRSTFAYWFAHWCAYQMTALNLGCWKFKYLFHDMEKPWMKLFLTYKQVQQWHNKHSSHHLISMLLGKKPDYEAMIIDWECSRFTKQSSPRNAAQEYHKEFNELHDFILTYHTHKNKVAEFIKENNLNTYKCAKLIRHAYKELHKKFVELNIPHIMMCDYLEEYFKYADKENKATA